MRILILLVLFTVSACDSSRTEIPKTVYGFEYFELPDGTPCYLIKVGSHSGIAGTTCNYGDKKS